MKNPAMKSPELSPETTPAKRSLRQWLTGGVAAVSLITALNACSPTKSNKDKTEDKVENLQEQGTVELRNPSYDSKKKAILFPYDWNGSQYDITLSPNKDGTVNFSMQIDGKNTKISLKNESISSADELNHVIGALLNLAIKGKRTAVPHKGEIAFKQLELLKIAKDAKFNISNWGLESKLVFKKSGGGSGPSIDYNYNIGVFSQGESFHGKINRERYSATSLAELIQQMTAYLIEEGKNKEMTETTLSKAEKKMSNMKKVFEGLVMSE